MWATARVAPTGDWVAFTGARKGRPYRLVVYYTEHVPFPGIIIDYQGPARLSV